MPINNFDVFLKTLTPSPGVYQFYDKKKSVIYIGKAKNLKKRVSSYFQKNHDNNKTRILVKNIFKIEYVVVNSEMDALLLENNLIKKYKPKYNVLLKDDKTFPWICIKNERFPRVFYTRKFAKDGSEYFGPYTNMKTVITLLDLIKDLYPIRTCNYDLSEEKINSNKYKLCLEYHIGNCLAPCEKKIKAEKYDINIKAIKAILKGDFKDSIKIFNLEMEKSAERLDFESAQKFKEKIESLNKYQSKSTIVNLKINNVDVFSIITDEEYAADKSPLGV